MDNYELVPDDAGIVAKNPTGVQALIVVFVNAVIVCAQTFGLNWTPDQVAAVMGVVNTFMALAGAAWVYFRVTPVRKVVTPND